MFRSAAAPPVLAPVRRVFRAVAMVVVPESAALDDDAWRRAEAGIEDALARRPPSVHRQLRLFLRIADWWPVPRYARRLSSLPPGPRRRVLRGLERAPLLLVRRGFWGVRTLTFMGYYALPEVREAIGYRAHPRGRAAVGEDGEGDLGVRRRR